MLLAFQQSLMLKEDNGNTTDCRLLFDRSGIVPCLTRSVDY